MHQPAWDARNFFFFPPWSPISWPQESIIQQCIYLPPAHHRRRPPPTPTAKRPTRIGRPGPKGIFACRRPRPPSSAPSPSSLACSVESLRSLLPCHSLPGHAVPHPPACLISIASNPSPNPSIRRHRPPPVPISDQLPCYTRTPTPLLLGCTRSLAHTHRLSLLPSPRSPPQSIRTAHLPPPVCDRRCTIPPPRLRQSRAGCPTTSRSAPIPTTL